MNPHNNTTVVNETQQERRLVILRTEEGLYVGRRGRDTILVKEKQRAVVWDWDTDQVEESIAQVKREFGKVWTPESADVSAPDKKNSIRLT